LANKYEPSVGGCAHGAKCVRDESPQNASLFLFGRFGLLADPEDAEAWRKRPYYEWVYRFGGVLVFVAVIVLVKGTDITSNVVNFFTR
jgi:hypothetical protein